MNLNEVKKHVYFQLALYIGIGLCLLLSMFAILLTPVKAMEQTTDITSTIKSNYDCPFGYGSTGYCAINTDNTGGVRQFNTRYNGVLSSIGFGFPYYFNQNSSSQIIDIYSSSNDFRNNNINVYCYSYESSPSQSNTRTCSLRFIDQKHIQVVFPYDSLQWHEIILSSNSPITGVSNYLIQKVTLTYDDGQQDLGGIIENATGNTTDIINNNNSNTESIINAAFQNSQNIINQIRYSCANLFNINDLHPNGSNLISIPTSQSFMLNLYDSTNLGFSTGLIPVVDQSTYSFKAAWSTGMSYAYMVLKIEGYDELKRPRQYYLYNGRVEVNENVSITMPAGVHYIKVSYLVAGGPYNGSIQFGSPIINLGSSAISYCEFGTSTGNRIEYIGSAIDSAAALITQYQDEMKDIQEEQKDFITDDSDPTLDQSEINNVLGSVNVQDPLNYLLTLPLNLLTKLNTVISSGTCSKASFGELYGTELYLPCINFENYLGSSLWGTIDTIVGIGLLAIILKKFYDTISNILSLGKEEEIRKGMELPTPMEFFAQILGGGR